MTTDAFSTRPINPYRGTPQRETELRASYRQTVRDLHEKPWLDGRYTPDTIRTMRRLHTESIERSRHGWE
jgi:hypothetical protein